MTGPTRTSSRRYGWLPLLVLVLASVMLLTAGACLTYVQTRLLEANGESLAQAAADVADTLDRILFERHGDVQTMAYVLPGHLDDAAALTGYINQVKEHYLVYRWIGVTDARGRVVAATDQVSVGTDWSGAVWFQEARDKGGLHVAYFAPTQENIGVGTVGFSAAVVGNHGEFRGAVMAMVALSELEDIGAQIGARFQEVHGGGGRIEWQYAALDGRLIADSILREEGRTNLNALQLDSARLGASGQRGYIEEMHARRNVSVLTGFARTEGYSEFTGLNWVILVRMDRDDIVAPIAALLWRLGAVGAFLIMPLLGLLLWSTRCLRKEWALSEQQTMALQEVESRSRALLESTSEGIFGVDRSACCIFINHVAAVMFGYKPEEVLGTDMHEIFHPRSDRPPCSEETCQFLQSCKTGQYCRVDEDLIRRRDQTTFPATYALSPLSEGGVITGTVVTIADITQRKQVESQLTELANHDALTGLPNRRLFLELLNKALPRAGRTDRLVALLFLDIDRFKLINDTLGHACGDCLLKAFAGRLTGCVRTTDTVARPGGDEFTILLEDLLSSEEAAAIAQRILDAMARPFPVEGRDLFVTASIGITLYPSGGVEAGALLTNADTAMYAAKESRSAFMFYSPDMNARPDERLDMDVSLRHGLQRQEFLLHYQPQVDVRTGTIVGVEALIRWRRPDDGLVAPGTFIPLAEANGLIVPIGEWVLRTACAQVKGWQVTGHPFLRLAVNLSRRQLQHPGLIETVRRILQETALDPHWLELEITESLLIDNAERTIATLQALRALGIRLAVDDFGTGYSSLSYLKDLPVDALKIDRSFVQHMATNLKDALIVKAIIGLARCLNLAVIAEGVETVQQRDLLCAEQCFEMQGYHFGPPLAAEELEACLVRCEAGVFAG